MIYYQYSQHFRELKEAILWAEKQKPMLSKIGSNLFIKFNFAPKTPTYIVYRSQCHHDTHVANMATNEGIEKNITFHEYITRPIHGFKRRVDVLFLAERNLGKGIYL
jgi:hypothetical protein